MEKTGFGEKNECSNRFRSIAPVASGFGDSTGNAPSSLNTLGRYWGSKQPPLSSQQYFVFFMIVIGILQS